ncbi:cupin domain-containing protein [Herbiconiux solani]|uniref:cupin domain-containing protein n=1 Tax=Herbiconiux solani TaxID=661329 RepID=UPI0008241AB3|nr:cupin domain-containing protein [Herbiconiux solani]
MADAPVLTALDSYTAYRISPEDTVRLVPLTGPVDGSPSSVFLEIWDPEGAQPDNSHPDSVEVFLFLKGSGVAYSDENEVPVTAGDVLTLPIGSVHHIVNTSTTEKLYSVTIMTNDLGSQPEESTLPGFYDLVVAGTPEPLDDDDLAVVFAGRRALALG